MRSQDIAICRSHELSSEVDAATHDIVVDETHLEVHGEKTARTHHTC